MADRLQRDDQGLVTTAPARGRSRGSAKPKPKGSAPSRGTPARRKKSARAELEADLLESPRWSGLRQQQRLQQRNHSPEQNAADRAACRALVQGGWGTDPEFVAWRRSQGLD